MSQFIEIKTPALGESVTEATVIKLHKGIGDSVAKDEILVELETDKVTLEVPATTAGVVKEIIKKEGDIVAIDDLLITIEENTISHNKAQPTITNTEPNNKNNADTSKNDTDHSQINHSLPDGKNQEKLIQQTSRSENIKNAPSPSATKIFAQHNVSPQTIGNIEGTGKDGRITKSDAISSITNISNISSSSSHQTTHTSLSSPNIPPKVVGAEDIRGECKETMTRLRQTIARRLKESQNTAVILSTFNEIDMFEVMRIRSEYQEQFKKKHGIKLGFMSFFLKATVAALKEFPTINAEIQDKTIVYKNYCDIGVAVGTETGLVVPIIRNAEHLNFAEIEQSIADLAKKAKEKKLSMSDMTGGTFSITNGGTYGSLLSTPIINPPQSGILGMHNIVQRPVVIKGEICIRPMMYVALSYDHRIIDGKEAVSFLVKIKNLIESPEKMLFDL